MNKIPKPEIKSESKWNIKKFIYIFSLMIVFTGFVQLTIHTFINTDLEYPRDKCIYKEGISVDKTCSDKYDEELKTFENLMKKERLSQFITSLVISLITLFIINFLKFNDTINNGLFFGLTINLLISMTYLENSYTAVCILFLILIGLIYYIKKDKTI